MHRQHALRTLAVQRAPCIHTENAPGMVEERPAAPELEHGIAIALAAVRRRLSVEPYADPIDRFDTDNGVR